MVSKLTAACEAVAQGVVAELASVIEADVDLEYLSSFGPEACAALSGIFDDQPTHAVVLSPSTYSTIVPTNGLSLDPNAEGVYGIDKIYKGTGLGDVLVLGADAVAGAIATPEILKNHAAQSGMSIQEINFGGIPMIVKSEYTFGEVLKVSVETLAGFAIANENSIHRYKIGEAPTPENGEEEDDDEN